MKKILSIVILANTLFALDFRVGFGSYDTSFEILNFADHKTTNDTTVFMINEPRSDLKKGLFYYYDLEYHIASNKQQETKFGNPVANREFPLVGKPSDRANDLIDWRSVDGDYEGLGFDLNFGLGYDIFSNQNGYLAIALNSGATLPNISAKNIKQRAEFAYKMIKKWDLDVGTYKIGLALRRSYLFRDLFNFYGSIGYGFQKAYIESEMFKSDVDSTGTYSSFDIGVKTKATNIVKSFSKNLSLSLGFSRKKWSIKSVDVNLFNYYERDMFRPFELDLKSSYTYFGVEYRF